MPEQLNSNWQGLSAGAKDLYVTVWLFTMDVCMLRFWKISSPDFLTHHYCLSVKISITFLRLLWDWVFFFLRFLFKPRPDPVIFLIFCSRLSFASINRFLKIFRTGYSGSLLSMSVIILEPVFKASFPTAFAPEYNNGLTKRESPEKGP